MTLAAETYVVTAKAAGYADSTATVTIVAGGATAQDFSLSAAPPPPPTAMWVDAMSSRVAGHKHLWINVQVTSDAGPVPGAAGKLELTGPESWQTAFITDSLGMGTIRFRFLARGLYRATVTSLTAAGYLWDPSRGINFIDITV
jgi:hypothetical protein